MKTVDGILYEAEQEAKQNLSDEDLEKCFAALEAWGRNTTQ